MLTAGTPFTDTTIIINPGESESEREPYCSDLGVLGSQNQTSILDGLSHDYPGSTPYCGDHLPALALPELAAGLLWPPSQPA